jgi:DNA-binding transcriptional LysR family regulator
MRAGCPSACAKCRKRTSDGAQMSDLAQPTPSQINSPEIVTTDIAVDTTTTDDAVSLAMAESGCGVAIVPSTMRIHRYPLRIIRVTYRGEPLREPLAIFWDKRRPLPRYATAYCEMLAEYAREMFPISRPTEIKRNAAARRTVTRQRARATSR